MLKRIFSLPSSRLYTRGETSNVPPLPSVACASCQRSRVHVSAGCILVHDDPSKLCSSVKLWGESREGGFRREMKIVCLEWWCKKRSVMRKGRILLLSERDWNVTVSRRLLYSWLIGFVWSIFFFFIIYSFFFLLFVLWVKLFCERLIEVGVSTR